MSTSTLHPSATGTHGAPVPSDPPRLSRRARPVPGLGPALAWRVMRRDTSARAASALPVTAFAVVTTVVLTVVAGALTLDDLASRTDEVYRWLAFVAVGLLVIPVAALCSAAARLCARRRDDALSSLRLVGAPRSLLLRMTLVESLALSLAGIAVGILGHAALVPAVGLLEFGDQRIGSAGAWIGFLPLLACLAGLVLVATLSALVGLRSVSVTPLGVVQRSSAGTARWIRVGALVVGLPVLYAVARQSEGAQEIGEMAVILVVVLAGGMAVLNLVGPLLLRGVALLQWRRARSVSRLLAARTVLDDPSTAWRRVSGVAVATFVAVIAGAGLAQTEAMDAAAGGDPYVDMMYRDMRTGVVLTLAFTFVLVACAVGVTQAAEVLDRRRLYVGLDRLGVPRRTMTGARNRAVLAPLLLVVIVAGGSALLLIAPFAGPELFVGTTMWSIAIAVVAGVLLVRLAVAASAPLLRRVLDTPDRVRD